MTLKRKRASYNYSVYTRQATRQRLDSLIKGSLRIVLRLVVNCRVASYKKNLPSIVKKKYHLRKKIDFENIIVGIISKELSRVVMKLLSTDIDDQMVA